MYYKKIKWGFPIMEEEGDNQNIMEAKWLDDLNFLKKVKKV